MTLQASSIAQNWLYTFATHLASGDANAIASDFTCDGWLRDILVFSWNNRTLHTRERIAKYLFEARDKCMKICDMKIDERRGLAPQFEIVRPGVNGVSSGFTFITPIAKGQGYLRLEQLEGEGTWKAHTVFTTVADLIGHEELDHELGVYGKHTLAWEDVNCERRKEVEDNPHVLIVGAGQTGLNIAARFKQMNIRTLIVEANERVGDTWRQRYPTLTLHTIRAHHNMLYQPYPKNWPTYTPGGKLATWLEFYAESQDLVIWTKSRPLPTPTYDYSTRRWTMNIDRNGNTVTIHPVHIILATGTLGKPYVPDFAGRHLFKGKAFHTSQYTNGKSFAGKNVVVIGSGNSAADICLELSVHNVKSMTMVQRSSTTVVNTDTVGKIQEHIWPEDIPTHISDFKFSSIPISLMKKNTSEQAGQLWVEEQETLRKLRKAGLLVDLGDDDSGVYPLVFERLGGYMMDVGFADFADTGKVKIISGVELVRFEENGIILSNGMVLEADVVIFGTGYHNIRHSVIELFGEETIKKTSRVWGLDEEGELYGCYRPTGHPGLWYGAGDFHNSRFGSKQLGVLIKSIELGYVKF